MTSLLSLFAWKEMLKGLPAQVTSLGSSLALGKWHLWDNLWVFLPFGWYFASEVPKFKFHLKMKSYLLEEDAQSKTRVTERCFDLFSQTFIFQTQWWSLDYCSNLMLRWFLLSDLCQVLSNEGLFVSHLWRHSPDLPVPISCGRIQTLVLGVTHTRVHVPPSPHASRVKICKVPQSSKQKAAEENRANEWIKMHPWRPISLSPSLSHSGPIPLAPPHRSCLPLHFSSNCRGIFWPDAGPSVDNTDQHLWLFRIGELKTPNVEILSSYSNSLTPWQNFWQSIGLT